MYYETYLILAQAKIIISKNLLIKGLTNLPYQHFCYTNRRK